MENIMSAVGSKHEAGKVENFNFFSFPKTGFGRTGLFGVAVTAVPAIALGIGTYNLLQIGIGTFSLALTHYSIHRLENPSYESPAERMAKKVFSCCTCLCCKKSKPAELETSEASEASERAERSRGREREKPAHSRSSSTERSEYTESRVKERPEHKRSSSVEGRPAARMNFRGLLDEPVVDLQPQRRPQAAAASASGASKAPAKTAASSVAAPQKRTVRFDVKETAAPKVPPAPKAKGMFSFFGNPAQA